MLALPAWAGLPRRTVRLGLSGAAAWWGVALWLFWGYQPRYNDFYHTYWARWWIEGNITELARNWPGTLIRPYVYHAALGAIGNVAPSVLVSEFTRPAISFVQVATFAAAVFRLAQAVFQFGHRISHAVIVGLLCVPFAVLTNSEVLSESISLSIVALIVALACPSNGSPIGRLGNVTGVVTCLALLAMTRTSHLPVTLIAVGAIFIVLVTHATRGRKNRAIALWLSAMSLVGWVVVLAPQVWLMWQHFQWVPNDPALWGVSTGQLLWSQQMGKYATVVASCPTVPVAGVAYPVPFADATSATGLLSWYVTAPHVAAWHLFQSLNWDFPTTYVSSFNPFMTIPLNAVSLAVVVIGFWTVARVAPQLIAYLAAEAPVLGVVLAAIAGLWLQTAFTAVETRFGIIPWSALSVSAAWGAARWWDRLRSGGGSWVPVMNTGLATGTLLVVSRMAVASVPAFHQLEAAGCWK